MTFGFLDILAFGALLVVCYTDITTGKIPNAVTLPLVLAGVVYHLLAGPGAWYLGLLGLAVAFPIHYGFWAAGIDKGGDAKMMMAIGALYGPLFALEATAWNLFVYLPVGVGLVALRGKLPNFIAAVKWSLKALYAKIRGFPIAEKPEPTYVARAPVILVAVLFARYTDWLTAFGLVTGDGPA